MATSLLEMVAGVVTAQAGAASMKQEALADLIRKMFDTFQELADYEASGDAASFEEARSRLEVLRSNPVTTFQRTRVYCLECGRPFKLLSNRHLETHGLTPRTYKQKWGLRLGTSLSAQILTERRRQIAKSRGTGSALVAWRAARKQATA